MALLQVSSHPPTFDDVFSIKDMKNMVDTIDTEPDPIPMRWFNAFVGRVFFGFYRTEAFEQVSQFGKVCIYCARTDHLVVHHKQNHEEVIKSPKA